MPRKGPAPKRPLVADPVYQSPLVTQLVNKVLKDGKRSLAERIVYAALEGTRTAILTTAGSALGIPPHTVTIESLADLLAPAQASAALGRSAELRGLLAEIAREHGLNRALMRQELSFLDHLTRLIGQEPDTGYSPHGSDRKTVSVHRVLDTQA